MRHVPFTYACTYLRPISPRLVFYPTLMSSASRSKSPSPAKKATPEIVVDKPEATVNVEDVASSGGAEDEKPDTSDVGESSFSSPNTIFPLPSILPPPSITFHQSMKGCTTLHSYTCRHVFHDVTLHRTP
jgi:hypothetical protein